MKNAFIGALLAYLGLSLVVITQCQRADRAEHREEKYKAIVERQQVTMKNQSDALQRLMTATDRLMEAQNP